MMFDNKSIFVSGGQVLFGKNFCKYVINNSKPKNNYFF